MRVKENLNEILSTIPNNVTLVAATKYLDAEHMKVFLDKGINNFGENRVEAFLSKYAELKEEDIKWHFIGHLQRNKAKKIINKIDCLHSLDSLELAKMINQERTKPLDIFVEVSINLEESKNGVPYDQIVPFVKEIIKLENVNLIGFMMMSVKYSNEEELHNQFKKLRLLKDQVEEELNINIPYLSMGMSDDYKVAISEGATHVRLGRILLEDEE